MSKGTYFTPEKSLKILLSKTIHKKRGELCTVCHGLLAIGEFGKKVNFRPKTDAHWPRAFAAAEEDTVVWLHYLKIVLCRTTKTPEILQRKLVLQLLSDC